MISYFYYYSAKRRLREANITIDMMGGEEECQPMVVAQRDMLVLETEYYQQKSARFTKLLLSTVICVILFVLYYYGVMNALWSYE